MKIDREENGMGGSSYLIPSGFAIEKIPARILKKIGGEEIAFFRDPENCLAAMIRRCGHESLTAWLTHLQSMGFLRMEVHTSEHLAPTIVFRFRRPDFEADLRGGFTLPEVDPTGKVHPSLMPIYLIIGGTVSFYGEASNDLEALPHSPFSDMGWMKSHAEIDAAECFTLFIEPDGNVVGWHPSGRAVYCDHGEMSWLGTLEDILDGFFAGLVRHDAGGGDDDIA